MRPPSAFFSGPSASLRLGAPVPGGAPPHGHYFVPIINISRGFSALLHPCSLPPPPPEMMPYETIAAAEAALGRNLTAAETIWFHYSAKMPDSLLYFHNYIFLFIVFTLVPLPLAVLELRLPSALVPYKLQPMVQLPPASFFRCYKDVLRSFLLVVGPLQLFSYPIIKFVGIRTGLPLPSAAEMAAQLAVYFLVEDYGNYWIHRLLHGPWGYEKIHRVHHEFTAPIGFAAPYAHWAEVLILGIPSFVGPAIAPCHMITFWLWIILRQVEAIETHSGYEFPLNPTKYIPFYGGAEYHDYHHYVGSRSQSNFASVFTYCDYIYGTDKGYRYYKAHLAKLKEQ
ncbi:very-long-chain aldehyde decarbonylase GL1-10 [Elaeis guineensis]|uniref:very-long-chain aldehyde decarbonylase GL1-10 n=1 Tax=Elaeis guineensis var. tenera TaxID=51953 RepID=UPI00094F58F1